MAKAALAPPQPATGIKQTIQARHGVATYVPQGYTIKIINTYGKQVVDTWAFALHAPPEDSDIDTGEKDEAAKDDGEAPVAGIEDKVKSAVENSSKAMMGNGKDPDLGAPDSKAEDASEEADAGEKTEPTTAGKVEQAAEQTEAKTDEVVREGEDAAEKAGEADKEKAENASKKAEGTTEEVGEKVDESADKVEGKTEEAAPKKSRWSAYIPSLPQRNKSQAKKKEKAEPDAAVDENMSKSWSSYLGVGGGQKEGSSTNTNSQSKGWSAYLPSGQGFSSYMPTKDTISAFAGSHYRDPTKSYAEQLFDFSKTPVGAAGLSGKDNSCVSYVVLTIGSCHRVWICGLLVCRVQSL